jgi:hypothetical protein
MENKSGTNKITLVADANKIVSDLIKSKEYQAERISCMERGREGHITVFSTSMQNLVSKTGMIVSTVVVERKIQRRTYIGSVDYLCDTILKDKSLYSSFRITEINENANNVKHSLEKNKKLDIPEIIHQFNRLIDKLVVRLGLTALNAAKLTLKVNNPPASIFAEKKNEKFEMVAGHRIALQLQPNFTIDMYAKTASGKLVVRLNENSDDELRITAMTKNGNRQVTKNSLNFAKDREYKLGFTVKEGEIQNNVVTLSVELEVFREKTISQNQKVKITTGALFWKKEKTISVPRQVQKKFSQGKITVVISQKITTK